MAERADSLLNPDDLIRIMPTEESDSVQMGVIRLNAASS